VMVPVIALMLFMGLYPRPLLRRIEPSVALLLGRVQTARFEMQTSHVPALASLAAPSQSLNVK